MASGLSWPSPFIDSRAVVATASGDDASSTAFNAGVESRRDAAAASARPMRPVEELFQVKVDHNADARADVLLHMRRRLMGQASGLGSQLPSDPARDDVLALRSSFAASEVGGGIPPPSCWSCSAHKKRGWQICHPLQRLQSECQVRIK